MAYGIVTPSRYKTDGSWGLCHTLTFTTSQPLTYKAGQHGLFFLRHSGHTFAERWRAFSIASAPSEGVITISTHIKETPSEYKAQLAALAIGDTMTLFGPFGEFYVRPDTTAIVGIAGGIGITPFRSLLIEIANQALTHIPVTLIYSTRLDHILYHDELELLKVRLPLLVILYCEGVEATTSKVLEQIRVSPTATYFLSGAPQMLAALQTQLRTHNIEKIIRDPFKGY